MIKNFVINQSINLVSGTNKYTSEQLEEIKYGLEGIYVAFSKIIVILIASSFLGIFKEVTMFLILFNILRTVAFGLHASKSIWCWISSSILFLFIPYISIHIVFPTFIYVTTSIFSVFIFIIYAPADTHKRPLINKRKRKIYKWLSIIFANLFTIYILITNNYLLKNLLAFALLLETILILPITYKIFKLPYNNYLGFKD